VRGFASAIRRQDVAPSKTTGRRPCECGCGEPAVYSTHEAAEELGISRQWLGVLRERLEVGTQLDPRRRYRYSAADLKRLQTELARPERGRRGEGYGRGCADCGAPLSRGDRERCRKCAGRHLYPRRRGPLLAGRERQVKEERRRLEELKQVEDLMDVQDIARSLDRSSAAVIEVAVRLGLGKFAGPGHGGTVWVFTRDDFAAIKHASEASGMAAVHGDPRRFATWYLARFKSTALFGRLAKALSEEPVGRPPVVTSAIGKRILELRKQGLGVRTIARDPAVGVSHDTVATHLRNSAAGR
jgi:hypothetical protein